MLDVLLFGALPYVALTVFLLVTIIRYRRDPYTFSTLSSQFMESRKLFWGSVPFHIGLGVLFFGHLFAFVFPRHLTIWNAVPVRLFILETSALAAGLLTAFGLCALIVRRASSSRLQANTSVMDIVVYAMLLIQIGTGLWVALTLRWGSAWFTHTATPYLWSIFELNPDIARIVELPLAARLHVIGAWLLIGLFGFTRLVHALVAPVPYLWRPVQLVIWNWRRRRDEAYTNRLSRGSADDGR
jgi:nitrate reductase gamma subunit